MPWNEFNDKEEPPLELNDSWSRRMMNSNDTLVEPKPNRDTKCNGKAKVLHSEMRKCIALWRFEVLAIATSISCVAGIIAVLSAIEGEPYQKWRIFNVQITRNSLLAILSAISKSSLMLAVAECLGQLKWKYFSRKSRPLFDLELFDRASRGPLGSLNLILRVRAKAFLALAAVSITGFAIALEPSAQQILSFPTMTKNITNGGATISAAQGFGPLEHMLEDEHLIDLNHALLAGTIGVENQPNYKCPSSQCRWSSFSTLGLCNQCREVSRDIRSECEFFRETRPATQICTYRFPKSKSMPDVPTFQTSVRWTKGSYTDFYASPAMNYSVTLTDNLPHVAVVETIQFSDRMYHGNYSDSDFRKATAVVTPLALQCEISWCHQIHARTSFKNGILNDPTTIVTDLRVGRKVDKLDGFVGSPLWPADGIEPFTSALRLADWQSDHAANIFWMSRSTSRALGIALQSVFGTTMRDIGPLGSMSTIDAQRSPLQIRISYGNLTQILDEVAASLTNRIRQTSFTRHINGTAEKDVTVVNVNWYWLMYPVALVALSAAFLSYCIVSSNASRCVVWKSSSLPLVLRRLRGYEEHADSSNELLDLECEARELRVRLSDDHIDGQTLHCVNGTSAHAVDDEK